MKSNRPFRHAVEVRRPTPNGFSFAFLKKYWDLVGNDFYFSIKYFEMYMCFDKGSNSSFLKLVPKIHDPNTISDFQPISLIGCLYKTIAKVLAERLKKVVLMVVSSSQTTFSLKTNISLMDHSS